MTVTRTTGGKWNPQDPNLAFLAGNVQDHKIAQNPCTLIAVNELRPSHDALLDEWCDKRRVLLDSGIFALTMGYARRRGIHLFQALTLAPEEVAGFGELWDRYCELVTRYADRLWGVIELDQGGAEHKPRTRERITRETGVVPIPVYHPLGDGWDYYDTLAATHDRVCFANLAKATTPARLRLTWTAVERARAYPHLWTHLLGVTPSTNLLSMGLRGSVDSSAWLSTVRWSSSWRSWALLDRMADFPVGMTYRRGTGDDEHVGHRKAKALVAAQSRFQQEVLAAVPHDTHPTHYRPEVPTP